MEHQEAHNHLFINAHAFQDQIGNGNSWFCWRRKENQRTQRKNLLKQGREPTTNSTHILYLSNRPQVSMVYSLINHAGCWKNTRRICKSRAAGF